jgi:solute carrier family 27 (fatty acid transporter), member 1/4
MMMMINISNECRFVFMASGMHELRLKKSDRVYCPLPLYHTAGGVISVGQAFIMGCTVIIRNKFSASQYFPDCAKYNATVSILALLVKQTYFKIACKEMDLRSHS